MRFFAEHERTRQFGLAHRNFEKLLNVADNGIESSIDPWLDIYYLKIALKTWKKQLQKVVEHADELFTTWCVRTGHEEETREVLKCKADVAGIRIKERVREIIDDYDEKIGESEMVMEGTPLANSLVFWS